jgi:hypothetical protein
MFLLFEIGSLMLLYIREARRMAEQMMKNMYYTPSNPGSYGGKEKFQRSIAEETGCWLGNAQVNDWLAEQDAYTLQEPVRKQFPLNILFLFIPCPSFRRIYVTCGPLLMKMMEMEIC